MVPKRQYNELDVSKKLQVIQEVDKGLRSKTDIANQYGIPKSTLSTYLRNRESIESLATSGNGFRSKKKARSVKCVDWEKQLLDWCLHCKAQGIQLFEPMVKEKGQIIAQKLGLDFKCSNEWYQKFQQRCDDRLPLNNEASLTNIEATEREALYSSVVDSGSSILEINEIEKTEENSWNIPFTLVPVEEDHNQEYVTESLNESKQMRISDVTSKANEVQSYLFRRLTDAERKLAEIDEDESFGRMVISTIRRLPPRKNAEVKIKIMEILFEAEYGEKQEMKQD